MPSGMPTATDRKNAISPSWTVVQMPSATMSLTVRSVNL